MGREVEEDYLVSGRQVCLYLDAAPLVADHDSLVQES